MSVRVGLLSGKRALVTGATSGIGRATAKKFAEEGAKVAFTGRNIAALDVLKKEIPDGISISADLTNAGACERVVREAALALGGIDILVNCAGILQGAPVQDTTLAIWDNNFNANTRSVFEMMQHAIPHLKDSVKQRTPKGEASQMGERARKPTSAILNVSSVNGLQSFAGTAAYCASKAATDQLTRCSAVDLAQFGIRVNAINPGVVLTELQKRGGQSEDVYANFLKRSREITHPLGRVGEPEEVADLIAFLCSDKAGFITGDCVAVDGGRACLGAR